MRLDLCEPLTQSTHAQTFQTLWTAIYSNLYVRDTSHSDHVGDVHSGSGVQIEQLFRTVRYRRTVSDLPQNKGYLLWFCHFLHWHRFPDTEPFCGWCWEVPKVATASAYSRSIHAIRSIALRHNARGNRRRRCGWGVVAIPENMRPICGKCGKCGKCGDWVWLSLIDDSSHIHCMYTINTYALNECCLCFVPAL